MTGRWTPDQYKQRKGSTVPKRIDHERIHMIEPLMHQALLHHWIAYHVADSRRDLPGFPDLHLVHPRGYLVQAECKMPGNHPTDTQREWLTLTANAYKDATHCWACLWRFDEHYDDALAYLQAPWLIDMPPGVWEGEDANHL